MQKSLIAPRRGEKKSKDQSGRSWGELVFSVAVKPRPEVTG